MSQPPQEPPPSTSDTPLNAQLKQDDDTLVNNATINANADANALPANTDDANVKVDIDAAVQVKVPSKAAEVVVEANPSTTSSPASALEAAPVPPLPPLPTESTSASATAPASAIASLNPDDAEFEHISQLDSKGTTFKLLTSDSYHSPEDIETLSRYRTEIDNIMSEVRQLGIPGSDKSDRDRDREGSSGDEGEARILQLCSNASDIEAKRKKLQDQIDRVDRTVATIQTSLEKINSAVAYWEEQRDFIRVGRWIVIQKKALRVLGIRDLKEMNDHLRKKNGGKNKTTGARTASSGSGTNATATSTKRRRSRNLPTSSQLRASIDADDFIEAASIMIAGGNGTKRKLVDVDAANDPASSPHHPSKKAKMVNLFNFYLSGGEKKQVNLHDDGFKLLYDKNDPDGAGIIVCATCNNKRVGQPRRMMRHAKSKRHQKNLAERRRLTAVAAGQDPDQMPMTVLDTEMVAGTPAAIESTSRCIPVSIVESSPSTPAVNTVLSVTTEKNPNKVASREAAESHQGQVQQSVSSAGTSGGVDIGVDELNNLMEL